MTFLPSAFLQRFLAAFAVLAAASGMVIPFSAYWPAGKFAQSRNVVSHGTAPNAHGWEVRRGRSNIVGITPGIRIRITGGRGAEGARQ
jgi:hypothetical protein